MAKPEFQSLDEIKDHYSSAGPFQKRTRKLMYGGVIAGFISVGFGIIYSKKEKSLKEEMYGPIARVDALSHIETELEKLEKVEASVSDRVFFSEMIQTINRHKERISQTPEYVENKAMLKELGNYSAGFMSVGVLLGLGNILSLRYGVERKLAERQKKKTLDEFESRD